MESKTLASERRKLFLNFVDYFVMTNRRLFLHGKPYFISFRTEEGLPFVPVEFMNAILTSCLAKALQLYPQTLIGFCFEPNHAHVTLVCENPETMPSFVGYVKQESAHAVNRLLGRKRKTVWADDYDAPIVLDKDKFLEKYAYTVLNPVKDGLVRSMDKYPGVSSYSMLMNRKSTKSVLMISRDSVPQLRQPHAPYRENQEVMERLRRQNHKECQLEIDHVGWKRCFPETADLSDAEVYELMLEYVQGAEKDYRAEHAGSAYPILHSESMLRSYRPEKFGRKSLCLSTVSELSKEYIAFFRDLAEQARETYLRWRDGETHLRFPPGMFAPCMPRVANQLATD